MRPVGDIERYVLTLFLTVVSTLAISLHSLIRRGARFARRRTVWEQARSCPPVTQPAAGGPWQPCAGPKSKHLKEPCARSRRVLHLTYTEPDAFSRPPSTDLEGSQLTLRAPNCWLFDIDGRKPQSYRADAVRILIAKAENRPAKE